MYLEPALIILAILSVCGLALLLVRVYRRRHRYPQKKRLITKVTEKQHIETVDQAITQKVERAFALLDDLARQGVLDLDTTRVAFGEDVYMSTETGAAFAELSLDQEETVAERLRRIKWGWTIRHVMATLALLGGVVILSWLGLTGYRAQVLGRVTMAGELYANVITEVLSILITVGIVGGVSRWQGIKREKQALILQMGSPDRGFAVEATRILRVRGWLSDGSLQKAWLREANLQDADLKDANLEGADLRKANLRGADLRRANLRRGQLPMADLEGADLRGADLRGTLLILSTLRGARLEDAQFDKTTTLPDGTNWAPKINFIDYSESATWTQGRHSSPRSADDRSEYGDN